jgi:hypothetical protein
MTKSHVGMGYSVCPICYKKHDEVVLLDRRLRDSLERDNFMGFDICPEHKAMLPEFIGLVEIANNTSQNVLPKDAKPTGNSAMMKRSVFRQVFNSQVDDETPFVYAGPGLLDQLQAMTQKEEGHEG